VVELIKSRFNRHSPDDMPSEQQDAPLATLTMRIVGKPRDSEIIPRGCSGFATIGPANLNFFRHQGAGLLSFAFEHGMVNRLTPGVATGGGRSSAMTRRMSWKNSLGTATSAIAAMIARTRTSRGTPWSVTVCWKTEQYYIATRNPGRA
jgi:hypothetical protein